jgi:hypothetical protein
MCISHPDDGGCIDRALAGIWMASVQACRAVSQSVNQLVNQSINESISQSASQPARMDVLSVAGTSSGGDTWSSRIEPKEEEEEEEEANSPSLVLRCSQLLLAGVTYTGAAPCLAQ